MSGADDSRIETALTAYRRLFDAGTGASAEHRKRAYDALVNHFYDMVTEFYKFGWGDSFHFAPRRKGESFKGSLVRCQHFLADQLQLKPGMKVLDVGCGVGGPMREIARRSGAAVVGVNNHSPQVAEAETQNRRQGLDGQCTVMRADFMNIPVPDGSFDGAYVIGATPHAPDKVGVFREVFRTLKPGAVFGGFEWCLTDAFDAGDPEHRRIKTGIEFGDGLPDIATTREVAEALPTAGFEVVRADDLAFECDIETPWYRSLEGRDWPLTGLFRTPPGWALIRRATRVMEGVGIARRGTSGVVDMLICGADNLVAGGRAGIFTPLFYFLTRKPA